MSGAVLVGDQLILEEEYDDDYIPSEQEVRDYAKEIGIDPDTEPELMWLAREGVIAPLPSGWKPCQDVTGDIYYFNFSTGQSSWEHPGDENYRNLVIQERERCKQAASSGGAKKDKKKKKVKEKKEKKKKEDSLGSALRPLTSPLGGLAPLRGLDAPGLGPLGSVPPLRRPLGSAGGLEPLKTSLGDPRSSGVSSVLGMRHEERVSLNSPGLDDEEDDDENKSRNDSDRPLKNLHLNIDDLGSGLQYEDSEGSAEAPEPELQNLALSRDLSPEPPSHQGRKSPVAHGQDGDREEDKAGPSKPNQTPDQSEQDIEEEIDNVDGEDISEEQNGGIVKIHKQLENKVKGPEQVEGAETKDDDIDKKMSEKDNLASDGDDSTNINKEKDVQEVEIVEIMDQKQTTGENLSEKDDNIINDGQDNNHNAAIGLEENKNVGIEGQKNDIDPNGLDRDGEDNIKSNEAVRNSVDEQDGFEDTDEVLESFKSEKEEENGIDKMDNKQDILDFESEAVKVEQEVSKAGEESLSIEEEVEVVEEKSNVEIQNKTGQQIEEEVIEDTHKVEAERSQKTTDEKQDSVEVGMKKVPSAAEDDSINSDASSFTHNKNLGDIKDLLSSISPSLEKKAAETRPKLKEAPAPRVDRLKLHQSSPSPTFSDSSHSDTKDHLLPKNTDLGSSIGFKRPETSRGRPGRSQDTKLSIQSREKKDEPIERHEHTSDREEQEEREKLMKEKQKRIQKLQDELKRQEEEEERRLKAESEERLRMLRESLVTKRKEEEAKLKDESEKILEELRASIRAHCEEQEQKIRQERKAILANLQTELEEEQEAERKKLEVKKKQDLERLKVETEEEIEEEKERLQSNKEKRLSALRQEVKSTGEKTDVASSKPEQHLSEYRRELSDVLQEVREEEEREHRRKMEQLKEAHRREIDDIREKYRNEESLERERMMIRLKDEIHQLEASHGLELEKIRIQHNVQIEKVQLENARKENELRDLSNELELRTGRLQSQEAMLQSKEEDLNRRRKSLGVEEQEVDRQIESLPRLIHEHDVLKEELEREREEKRQARELMRISQEEHDKAKNTEARLREERDRAREEQRRSKEEQRKSREEQQRLERRVQLLQERCERLSLRDSEIGGGAEASTSKLDPKSDLKSPDTPGAIGDAPLLMEELDPPLSPPADSHSSISDVKRYILSHGDSIQKTKVFLERESRKLVEREAALRAAQTNPGLERGATEDIIHNLQQEAQIVGDLQQTVQKGISLLQRKEEKLQHLESSLTDKPLFENTSRIPERTVTFDVSESDVSSTVDPPFTRDQAAVPHRVQDLVESLQVISGQLNTVVGVLGSLDQRPNPAFSLPQPGLDFSTAHMRRSQMSENWAPPPPMFSSTVNTGLKTSEDLINSRWRQIFPGAAMGPSVSKRSTSYSSHTPLSQSNWSAPYRQSTTEADGHRLQDLIDSNKRWLEIRRKDTNIPLLTRYRPATNGGLIQLGLDDNNEIRVFHY
ncbi:hypothetical protein NL108_011082 [Boleophthalmus pectinirostris]|uniref:centrosomal protein of 164 kDa isoform X2 n=1 Tax=Boleophthalmus pectinirostris TaxID=150288 RepID=UPI00242E263F|nr:centrosomal protein of 164 kDa isoform X2 [Boleophthalmus pectinirostris]KAJ0063835.1 hypothetical protein NL108_011082 [Boleophthalmus pectinirostris]